MMMMYYFIGVILAILWIVLFCNITYDIFKNRVTMGLSRAYILIGVVVSIGFAGGVQASELYNSLVTLTIL